MEMSESNLHGKRCRKCGGRIELQKYDDLRGRYEYNCAKCGTSYYVQKPEKGTR